MKLRVTLGALAAALGIVVACQPKPAECPPSITITVSDAGAEPPHPIQDETTVIVTDPDGGVTEYTEPFDRAGGYLFPTCAAACSNMVRLTCTSARQRPGEDSCYVVCKRAEGTGGRIDLKPACLAAAKTKAAIRACGTYRCP